MAAFGQLLQGPNGWWGQGQGNGAAMQPGLQQQVAPSYPSPPGVAPSRAGAQSMQSTLVNGASGPQVPPDPWTGSTAAPPAAAGEEAADVARALGLPPRWPQSSSSTLDISVSPWDTPAGRQ